MRRRCRFVATLPFILLFSSRALAGPPFITDDPEPVDPGHWEINNYISGAHARGEASGNAPGFDINYGALPELQLHINVASAYDELSGGGLYYGYADTELGVKYRFLDPAKDDWWPQAAIYPLLEIPTGNAGKGLGDTGQMREFLPIWLQKDLGDWTAFGGAGYWINAGSGNQNYWYFGGGLARKITDRLSLGGELFAQTAGTTVAAGGDSSFIGFNLGGTYDFSDTYYLLFSAGRGITNIDEADTFTYYLALQLTF